MSPLPKIKTTNRVLETRHDLIEKGYRPIPCKGKIPIGFIGWQHCAATHDIVDVWETSHPDNRNTGILTGEVVAIDVDITRPDLAEAIAAMVRELPGGANAPMRVGKAPKALFLFRTTEPREKIITAWFNIDGTDQRIEVMGTGQQVIVDGIHPDTGQPYIWTPASLRPVSELPLIDWASLERFLQDVEALLEPHGKKKPAPVKRKAANDNTGDNFFRRVNQAALDDLASWVPALNLPKTARAGEGYRAVAEWRGVRNANLSFHPEGITDWGSGEVHTAIDVVHKCGQADGVTSAAEWLCTRLGKDKESLGWVDKGAALLPSPKVIEALVAKRKSSEPINPFDPKQAGGLIGDVAEWILDTSRRRTPEFAVMAALAFLSAFYGRRVIGPTSLGVNLYLAGIAGPGFGKEAPQARILQLFEDAKLPFLIGPGEVTSASAIEKELRKKPTMLMLWDEFGEVMQSVNAGGSGNWTATIRKLMLEVFSKATSVWRGKEHASKETTAEPVYAPSLSIMGMSTPTTFYGGLSEANLTDGFIARLIFVSPKDRPKRSNPADDGLSTPASLLKAVADAEEQFKWPAGFNAKGAWRTAGARPQFARVGWANAEAEAAWLAIEDWQDAEIERDESRDGIVGRTAEHVVKLATLRALSRNPETPSVSVEDVAWARALAMASIDAVDSGILQHMSGSQFEAVCKAIITALRDNGGEMFRAALLRRRGVSKADERTFDGAVRRLQESGHIEKTDGRKMTLTAAGWGK
ncbi:hypothetical protein HNR26_000004 [Rhizobium rosettiformans]|uniref:Bifunctional DNA primase/polymerase n=2 Tax=Rhizobium rosettiformans TaxID=1368430 RepID=A0A4S8Q553_9HYPH|nr:bifunctional DNA primase/polymerase [Rhizobium rosettiformans]MBB5273966.1 hypothetical protein [Rhizobium rosettiformans]THV38361.1 bifunctional DNA primase/polymerase [Rhizobium rosettiformans W3]